MRRLATAGPQARQAAADAVARALEVTAFAVPPVIMLGWTGAGVWWMADRFGPWAWATAVVVPTFWALAFWWLTRPEPSRGQARPVAGERCAPRARATVPAQSSGPGCEWTDRRGRELAPDRIEHAGDASPDTPGITGASTGVCILRIVIVLLVIMPLPVLGAIQLAHLGRWN
jgi:hypothetical protein